MTYTYYFRVHNNTKRENPPKDAIKEVKSSITFNKQIVCKIQFKLKYKTVKIHYRFFNFKHKINISYKAQNKNKKISSKYVRIQCNKKPFIISTHSSYTQIHRIG